MHHVTVEGWYQDPFRRHQHRWFSDGRPTALVRDGDVEAQDSPPDPDWRGEPEAIVVEEPAAPDQLGAKLAQAPFDAFTASGGSFS